MKTAGYTLLEMLIVLSIVAVLLAVGFSLRPKADYLQLQTATTALQRDIRYAHALSLQMQREIAMSFSQSKGTWLLDAKHQGALPPGARLSLKEMSPEGGNLIFYEDGTCTAASIELTLGKWRRSFSTSWLGCRIDED